MNSTLGQMHRDLVQGDQALLKVDAQAARMIGAGSAGAGGHLRAVAQGGADAGHQLRGAEGFGDIVVRAQIQGSDLLPFLGAGRK